MGSFQEQLQVSEKVSQVSRFSGPLFLKRNVALPTCRVVCEGLTGDSSGRLLERVGGGCGGRAGAGVVACHVG